MLICASHLLIANILSFDLNVLHVDVVHHLWMLGIGLIIFRVAASAAAVVASAIIADDLSVLIFVELVICNEKELFVSFFLRDDSCGDRSVFWVCSARLRGD